MSGIGQCIYLEAHRQNINCKQFLWFYLLRQREQENTCHHIMATLFWKGIRKDGKILDSCHPTKRWELRRSGAGQTEGGINETLGSR